VDGGIVDIFDTDGKLLTTNHFAANAPGAGPLSAPWGVTQAPADFGKFSNDIIIGNDEGPGYIDAFDPNTGAYLGQLTKPDGTPIAIPGLWYLTFGGGTPQTGLTKQLYFDAGPSLEQGTGHGLFGRIIAAGEDDGRANTAISEAGLPGLASMMQVPGPAPIPLLLIDSFSQSTGSQATSVAGQSSSLQLAASSVSNSITVQKTVTNPDSVGQIVPHTGNSQPITDVLDGPMGGLANGQEDVLGRFQL
jgi:hypothetical protein